jgi:hypothetical protein
LNQVPHGNLIHVRMEVADVQNSEAVKSRRQLGKNQVVSPNDNLFRIPPRAPIETSQFQDGSDDGWR